MLLETNSKRLFWPLAKVMEIFKGADGHARVAKVRLAGGNEFTRPFQRLYPMELSNIDLIDSDPRSTTQIAEDKIDTNEVSKNSNFQRNTEKQLDTCMRSESDRRIQVSQRLDL